MFGVYLELGFNHILDIRGLDHVLFLVALTIIYTLSDWKKVIILATAFTVGHSLTLALSATDVVRFPGNSIEILIAISIFLTAVYNLFVKTTDTKMGIRYTAAFLFGLIHGMGFSGFFRTILGTDDIFIPLLAFNIGVELAQILVVIIILIINYLILRYVIKEKIYWHWIISVVIMFWAILLIVERI